MQLKSEINGPIVIGGVGGSGTRVVAEILSKIGFYIGSDLNEASDNLLFTLLFKRPKWFHKNLQDRKAINTGITLFHKLMSSKGIPNLSESLFLARAVFSMSFYGHNRHGDGKGKWPFIRLSRLFSSNNKFSDEYIGWGWKEPNSHLLLQNFIDNFKGFKYIHTIRNGLDMAFSQNQQQLYNWGKLFGVPTPSSLSEEASASLKYWIRVNERVLEYGKSMGGDRFLIVNYDELCLNPERGIERLMTFLGIEVDDLTRKEILCLPKIPSSMGRYKSHDMSQFDIEDLNKMLEFGFPLK